MKNKASSVKEFLDIILTFIIVSSIFIGFRYFIRFPVVSGTSMLPTYQDCDRLSVLYTKNVSRNDIIVLWSNELNEYIVKRVAGVPGDKIEIKNGALYRNGSRIYESYVNSLNWHSDIPLSVTVPSGKLFLLGDNRDNSADSREFGMVFESDVFGRVIARLPGNNLTKIVSNNN